MGPDEKIRAGRSHGAFPHIPFLFSGLSAFLSPPRQGPAQPGRGEKTAQSRSQQRSALPGKAILQRLVKLVTVRSPLNFETTKRK
jgi:hypothetical protein